MNCKLITENDCAISAVLSCSPAEFLIINKVISRCSTNEDFAESDRKTMALMGKAMMNFEQVEVADTQQTTSTPYCVNTSSVCKVDTPQTDWHYDEQDATWYPYKHEDEPQTDCAWK